MKKPSATVAHTAEDPTIRFAKVEIEGKEYKLCFSFNAIARAEADTGINLLEGFVAQHRSATQFRALIYAAMSHAHPSLTLEEVGNLITPETLVPLANGLAKAYSMSMPDKEDDSKNE